MQALNIVSNYNTVGVPSTSVDVSSLEVPFTVYITGNYAIANFKISVEGSYNDVDWFVLTATSTNGNSLKLTTTSLGSPSYWLVNQAIVSARVYIESLSSSAKLFDVTFVSN